MPMKPILRRLCRAGALALAAAGCREAQSAPPSSADTFNQLQRERAASARAYDDRTSPEFAAAFTRVAAVTLPLYEGAPPADGRLALRPELCALTPAGDVYLGAAGARTLRVWPAGAADVRTLTADSTLRPRGTAALAWHPEEGSLYVLDTGRGQVRRYGPDGALRGFAALNAGQTNMSLAVTPGGALVLGGVRAEDEERATLLSVHDAAGRHLRAFFPMDAAISKSKLRAAPTVLVTPLEDGTFLAAEPTAPRVVRLTDAGEELGRMDGGFQGYRAPVPLADAVFDFTRAEAWTRSWDRLVFLHASGRHVYTGFQSWRGGRTVYRLEVHTREGEPVATGLRHDSYPACGSGDEIVLVSQGRPDRVEVTRWRFDAEKGGDA